MTYRQLGFAETVLLTRCLLKKLNDTQFLSMTSTNQKRDHSVTNFNKSCSACAKHVNNIDAVAPCYQCQSYNQSRKCSGVTEKDILNLGAQRWFCPRCRINIFPFNSAHAQDTLSKNFNSNQLYPCNDLTKDLIDYECLEISTELNLDKLDLNQFHSNADNDIYQNLNININFKYYTAPQFHKL